MAQLTAVGVDMGLDVAGPRGAGAELESTYGEAVEGEAEFGDGAEGGHGGRFEVAFLNVGGRHLSIFFSAVDGGDRWEEMR